MIMFFSGKRIYNLLADSSVRNSIGNRQPIALILRLTNKIANVLPWSPSCLCKVMVVRSLLYMYKIDSTVYLSVKKQNKKIAPHAWMEIGEIRYLYPADFNEYITVKTIN